MSYIQYEIVSSQQIESLRVKHEIDTYPMWILQSTNLTTKRYSSKLQPRRPR